MNALDSAVYGGTNSYDQSSTYDPYTSYNKTTPKYPTYSTQYSPEKLYSPTSKTFDNQTYGTTSQYAVPNQYSSSFSQYTAKPQHTSPTNTFGKPYSSPQSTTSPSSKLDVVWKVDTPTKIDEYKSFNSGVSGPGYVTSEVSRNTYKTPDGFQTNTYKYESYQSSSEPYQYTTSEKYYTTTPQGKIEFSSPSSGFDAFKNGSYTTTEYTTSAPVLKDTETLEQKMLKKSVTQHVTEKKTVSMSRSTKQESATKTFKFE